MSKCYSIVGPQTAGSGPNTANGVTATSAIRPMVNELEIGVSTTPADQTLQATLSRFTTAGTSTAFTPLPLDPADVASVSIGGITHTVEPTYTANQDLLNIYLNQRATFRWVAQDGREIVAPATAANGLGLRNKTSSASMTLQGTLIFRE